MHLSLNHTNDPIKPVEITISGSKSESNRLLILKAFYPNIGLKNLSDSDDTRYLGMALKTDEVVINIGHAGTAMRFLTAFFAQKEGSKIVLTGSERMQQRPIGILVEALRKLGADITYLKKEGYPPLQINGKKFTASEISIPGNISSQYISALMLIAAKQSNGLQIELTGEITSVPYLKMTLELLKRIGIAADWNDRLISIPPVKTIPDIEITVESDWSSASYFYSAVALRDQARIKLRAFRDESLQGDHSLVEIYKLFGVKTYFSENAIELRKEEKHVNHINLDLSGSPDIAQTIAVTCLALGMSCDLYGLHTLPIKETNRLLAMKTELEKLGASVLITDKSLHLKATKNILKGISIDTYNDHRMAMAFAPLSLKVPLSINNAEVVTKSYTRFWEDFEQLFR